VALLEDLLKGNIVTAVAMGATALVLPKVMPDLSPPLRSAVKGIVSIFLESESEAEGGIIDCTRACAALWPQRRGSLGAFQQAHRGLAPGPGPGKVAPYGCERGNAAAPLGRSGQDVAKVGSKEDQVALLNDAGAGLAPLFSKILRPGMKVLVRAGITLYRGAMEPLSTAVGELVYEAQLELATASSGQIATAAPGTGETAPEPLRRKHRRAGHEG